MNCSSAELLFEPLLDGELGAADRRRLTSHLDTCAACETFMTELRALDGLLIEPRRVELGSDFTAVTMAQASTLPAPARYRAPLRAYIVSYLAGAWLLAGAAYVLAPSVMHAATGATIDVARNIADVVGGLSAAISRSLGRGGSTVGAMLGALVALDLSLVVAFGAALKYVRPRSAQRLRS